MMILLGLERELSGLGINSMDINISLSTEEMVLALLFILLMFYLNWRYRYVKHRHEEEKRQLVEENCHAITIKWIARKRGPPPQEPKLFSNHDKFVWLMSNEDKIVKALTAKDNGYRIRLVIDCPNFTKYNLVYILNKVLISDLVSGVDLWVFHHLWEANE